MPIQLPQVLKELHVYSSAGLKNVRIDQAMVQAAVRCSEMEQDTLGIKMEK